MDRTRNPFISLGAGGRALSAAQLPLFLLHPPAGYAVLTTTGRRSGKPRRRCVRAARGGDSVYLVAIKGARITGWAKNALAQPEVRLRLPGGTFAGRARELRETEVTEARRAYCEAVHWFDYLTWITWRRGRPTAARVKELLRGWFDSGTPVVIELESRGR